MQLQCPGLSAGERSSQLAACVPLTTSQACDEPVSNPSIHTSAGLQQPFLMLLQLGRLSTVKLGHRCCRAAGAARGSGAHCIVTAIAEVTTAAEVAPECPGCRIAFSNELAMCTAVQARHCMHAAQQWARPGPVGAHALGALYRCHILVLQESVLRRHFAAACVHGGSCCMPKLPCSALCRASTDTTELR